MRTQSTLSPTRSFLAVALILFLFPVIARSQAPAAKADLQWKTHISRGISLLRQQKFELARQEFLSATSIQKDRSEGFLYVGLANLNLGQLPDAEQALGRALALNPRSAQGHYNLGLIYSRLFQVLRAKEVVNKLILQ